MQVKVTDVKVGKRFRKKLGDLDSLKTSIQEIGLLHPIVVTSENELICGRRRLEAYKELELEKIEATQISLEAFVYAERDENVCREKFCLSDAAAIVEAVEELEKDEAKKRQREHGGTAPGRKKNTSPNLGEVKKKDHKGSKGKAAKAVGMSSGTLAKVQEVVAAAEEDPEKYGDLAVQMDATGKASRAVKELKRRQEAERVANDVAEIQDENIIISDFRIAPIEPESISLIFTDPPYNKDSIGLFENLAQFASKTLKEGGSLLCFAPQYALPDIVNSMSKHLKYWWIIACKHQGSSARLFGWHVRIGWKPILWFVKGTLAKEYPMVSDYVQSEIPDKTKHKWAQSLVEAKYYIEHLTYPSEVVCDPFLGSGTTCLAAKLQGRKYIGIDISDKAAKIAKAHIHEFRPEA